MKRIFVIAAALALFSACNSGEKSAGELLTENDSLSYSLGVNVASSVQAEGLDSTFNVELFIQAFRDVMSDGNPLLTTDQAMECIQTYIARQQSKMYEGVKKEGELFMSQNASVEGVITLPSGLQYKVVKEGNGPKPAATDEVMLRYTGKFLDGSVFDSSGDSVVGIPLDRVIPGWQEGIPLMSVGSKYEFFIPYYLGYGEQGFPPAIPPFSTLVFEVELVSIGK